MLGECVGLFSPRKGIGVAGKRRFLGLVIATLRGRKAVAVEK
jgi:hypothetical protein